MSDEDYRASVHEAGHCLVAHRHGRPVRTAMVTGASGPRVLTGCVRFADLPVSEEVLAGFDPSTQFLLWPPELRRRVESDISIDLAGDIAERLLSPTLGRTPDPVGVDALAALGVIASDADRSWTAQMTGRTWAPESTDAEAIAASLFLACGKDPDQVTGLLYWLTRATEAIIIAEEQAVRRLAMALMRHAVLGGDAVAACIG